MIGRFKSDLTFGIHLHRNEFSTNQLKLVLGYFRSKFVNMAQNYNPFVEQLPENAKQAEDSKKSSNDNHAVTKRYVNSFFFFC